MSGPQWERQFFTTTRGRIVLLLRREPRTVEELARALDLTDNAVRAQLALLERDGLARQQGLRRGAGKPSVVYELAPEAENLFPKAFAPILNHLLDILVAHLTHAKLEDALRAVGR